MEDEEFWERPRAARRARRPRRRYTEGPDGDRNGEPAEDSPNCLLYSIVLAALAVVIGFELGLLFVLVGR